MPIEQWKKTLSRTDAGESSTHQAGILIPVREGKRMFPNGSGLYCCKDEHGEIFEIRFTDQAKPSESRITHLTNWMRRFSVQSGDRVILSALSDGSYCLKHLPVGESPKEETEDLSGFPEGGKMLVEANRYERDRRNRENAIAIHGTTCFVCDIRMADRYGEIADGFIHIHHVKSLSVTGENTPDIEKDLIPLCPNCHAVVHLTNPPMPFEELKRRMRDAGYE